MVSDVEDVRTFFLTNSSVSLLSRDAVNIRRQWNRLVEIANEMLPHDEQLVNAIFYRWRHTGASELAATGADPVMITRMMGDVSLTTVMEHYFDSSLEHMQEIVENWDQRGVASASVVN